MAEKTKEVNSFTPPNGHIMAAKSTPSDEASITHLSRQSDNSKVSWYKPFNPDSETLVSPNNQCSSTLFSSHPSALTGPNQQEDKTQRQYKMESSEKSISQPPSDEAAHKRHSPHIGSLSPNSSKKTNDDHLLRCELCNKYFSEADFDSKGASSAALTKVKITVCPDCHRKVLEGSKIATPTTNLTSVLPTPGKPSAHTNNVTAAKLGHCHCMASHRLTTSQIPAQKSTTVEPELLQTIKTEPPSEPYSATCETQANNPQTYHNHTYQTKCSIYLTANFTPCVKRDKEAVASNQDPALCGNHQQKKPKLDDSESPEVMGKGQNITSVPLIKSEISPSVDSSTDVKPSVAGMNLSSNGHMTKVEIKQEKETNSTESNVSSFKFTPPTKPAPVSSSAANNHKTKVNCTSNTYMFEGSMLWKPVHPDSSPLATSSSKVESPEKKSDAPPVIEKKEEEENTFSCEGSLFIKPLLPNEFAFEGTMYIKPDSPLLAQAPVSFANQPGCTSGSSSMPPTTKTLTIQSVFTSSGQVISSITTTSSDKSGHATSNGKSEQTQLSTVVTTSCEGGGSKCTVTSCCTNQINPPKETKKKMEQEKEAPAGFSQCQTSASGGGHTDFSVKSILSATDRRSSCDSRRYPQH